MTGQKNPGWSVRTVLPLMAIGNSPQLSYCVRNGVDPSVPLINGDSRSHAHDTICFGGQHVGWLRFIPQQAISRRPTGRGQDDRLGRAAPFRRGGPARAHVFRSHPQSIERKGSRS
jgi:hypothetical protein